MNPQYLQESAQGLFGLISACPVVRWVNDDLRPRDHAGHLGVDHLLHADEGLAAA